jgi:calcineurin-like phosphoesterase
MRLLFLGDVVGRTGREAVARVLPQLRQRHAPDLVVINGENAAHGFGITEEIYQGLVDAGADVVTLGNHSFDQREALIFIERVPIIHRACRAKAWVSSSQAAANACW